MGASGSVVLQEEASKPLDASDVDTPRGKSAKEEVARLRKLLSQNYDTVSSLLFQNLFNSPMKEGEESKVDNLPNIVEEDSSAVRDLEASSPGGEEASNQRRTSPKKGHWQKSPSQPKSTDRATHEELEALEAALDAEMAQGMEGDCERNADADCCSASGPAASFRLTRFDSIDSDDGVETKGK
mmetsp:Transcript_64813/g.146209  ORF Transcript_64813/g.146209 Transcript_64813/m.146209 type:complete len:184 (-) Transcript_64813:120-671(-)|eukprot:CAMPEP_0172643958 /NCGR_PEP_ID=MMETSP1068-20121228/238960_1 /TAXON_ID=35684 /ORGANISM="Pseudopedinella elastica, Strain CCMP716" /LENGTH=183 /DNA_ID=CAMNT_0013458135 /DNA_START=18 /DNA_END=569 /DNA_ORIENTATION=+